MNPQLVLVVAPDLNQRDVHFDTIERQIGASGLQVLSVADGDAVRRLQELTAGGEAPAVVLIGPSQQNALAVARRIRTVYPEGQILFVPDPMQGNKLRRELRYPPMIGPNWSLLDIGDPKFASQIKRAAQASRQRARLRTTLDRANVKLATAKPVDSLDYRRLVISEHYLANLLAQSQDAIVSLDTRDTVLYWNASAEKLFKLDAKQMRGLPAGQLPFWAPVLDACLAKIHAGASTLTQETGCMLASGLTDLDIFFSRVHDDTGVYIGTSLTLRDISARNRLIDVERTARRAAERMSRMKDEFLAILSHELRTPLSAVIGRTQLLQMRHRNEPELLSALDVIERNAQLQAKLIEDLLDISSVIAGKLRLDRRPLPLQQVVQAAVDSIRPVADGKQVQLVEAPKPIAAVIDADPHRMGQVLFNLLANAVKFTPPGGCVTVASCRTDSRVEIEVSDTGIGIDPDFLPLLFERFGQEDSSTTRRHGGLGLGLAIAKQIVELHGGSIEAASAGRNRGARFTVSLPLHDPRQDANASRSASQPALQDATVLKGRRILAVEDVADTRQVVSDVLQDHGAEVVAVESGLAALQALNAFHPDAIVSDIGMPGMDGYELLRKIRARGFTGEKLPALALTAFARPIDRAKALDAGFQAHLTKPLVVTELVAAVARLIGASQ